MQPKLAKPDRQRILRVAQGGIAVALAFVLSYFMLRIGFAGGGISFQMVPLLVLARIQGTGLAIGCGVVFGLLHLTQDFVVVHPLQMLLDYPLAFGALGLAGLLPRGRLGDVAGTILGCLVRYACHVLSGVIFIREFNPQLPGDPWLYSLGYNATYMVPSTVACLLLVPLIVRQLVKSSGSDRQ
ncbi:MAG: energy-coupled thiamine transporter ThiT [Armatimonadetes bacterium]|nr:energy-coupled thiamine transporter ThiT [Armatimonadota bacterium]